jgi:hypothetical protein
MAVTVAYKLKCSFFCCSLGEQSEVHGWHEAGEGWCGVGGLSPLLH